MVSLDLFIVMVLRERYVQPGGRLIDEKRKPSVRDTLRLGRALKLVWSVAPSWTVASVALTVVQGLLPLATVWLLKLIVDGVAEGVSGPDRGAAFRHVAVLIALAAAVGLATAVMRSLATMVDQALGQTVTDHVTDVIHSQSVAVDLEYYDSARYHDALYRAQQEAPFRPTSIVTNLTTTGQALVTLLSMAGLLLTLHWAVGLIILGAAIPGGAVRFMYSRKLFAWQRRRTEAERQSYYAHWLLIDSDHAKEIRLFGLGDRFRGWYRELRRQLRGELIRLAGRRSLAELGAGAAAVVAVFGTFAYIAWRAIQGTITVGLMVAYYQAFQTSLSSLQTVLSGLARLHEDNLFLSHLHDFLSLKPKVVEPTHPRRPPRPVRRGIRFERVAFRYPTGDRPVLRDVTLEIPAGKTVALVGANGSGKTTLAKLLCRLYDPTEGSISLDGMDLREMSTVALRREISVLFQDFARYDLSAWENIRLGDIALSPGDERIAAAARLSGADRVIGGLPHGYDTVLGHSFEDGRELSMGEWQSLALARAFARDAQIVVLDEPTSALDAEAEYGLFTRFRRLVEGRTALLISHRFSTARMADCIYVLEDGAIVEGGTHEELVRRGGYYARAFETQARSYR